MEPDGLPPIDWTLATWAGSRREALRRWAALPLDRIIASLEEMAELAGRLRGSGDDGSREPSRPRPEDT